MASIRRSARIIKALSIALAVAISLTQFFQGVASGGREQTSRYGDKFDLYMNADTGKLGLWDK